MKKAVSVLCLVLSVIFTGSSVSVPSDTNLRLVEIAKTYELNIYLMANGYFYWNLPVLDENFNVTNQYNGEYSSEEGEEVQYAQKPYGQYNDENKEKLKIESLVDEKLINDLVLQDLESSYYYNSEKEYVIQKVHVKLVDITYYVIWDKDGVDYMYSNKGV